MEASANSGSGSTKAQNVKILKDYDAGRLPPEFAKTIDIEELRAKVKSYEPFDPPKIMSVVWMAFWQLRNTKSYEHPISHTDVYHFTKVMGLKFEQWEVRGVFNLDRAWYMAYQKYNKQ